MHDIAQMLLMAAGGQSNGQVSVYDGGEANADVASLTSFTTAALAIGTASSSRLAVAMVSAYDAGSGTLGDPSSVTIGGVAATKVASRDYGPINYSMWVAVVPSGTTATVSATYARTVLAYVVKAYSLGGAIETPAYTASVTGNVSLPVVRNGAALVACGYQSNPALYGAGGEVVPAANGTSFAISGGGYIFLSYGSGLTAATETLTGSMTYHVILAASFAPK